MAEPKLAIVCQTYNQVKYIRQTLEGFVSQKTNFPFVVIIGDDCSTDGTTDIVREFEQKYPDIIKPVYFTENTKGVRNFFDTFNLCETEYVAWCEGDDYWTDKNKLQKQVDFLDNNPDYSICFHPVKILFENDLKKKKIFPRKTTNCTFENLLQTNFIQTNSVVYRWRFKKDEFEKYMPKGILPGDWYLHLLHAKVGKIKMLPDVMGVYRRQPSGIWYDSMVNPKRLHSKYGICKMNFYFSVYENIVDKSEKYYKENLLLELKRILYASVSLCNFENIKILKEKFPEDVENILLSLNIFEDENRFKKAVKLLKILTILFVVVILLFIMTVGALYISYS